MKVGTLVAVFLLLVSGVSAYQVSSYGVDKGRVEKVISSIDVKYFTGVKKISFFPKSPKSLSRTDGFYSPGGYITLYDSGYPNIQILRNVLLHELKHHYCYTKSKNLDPVHTGCFLSTPIDKQYGYIR
jgi:hypothetical protein